METIKTIHKTKYQQIADLMEKDGYISDTQTVKIFGNETGIYKVGEHIRKWKKLNADKNFFEGKKITEKKKGHRCHLVHVEGEPKNSYYKVGKEFWNLVEVKGQKRKS